MDFKTDWQEVSKKYDVPLESCRNLFVNHRAKPSLLQIRKFALDTDPNKVVSHFK